MRWPGQKRIWKGAPPAAIAEHITIDAVIEPIQRWHTSNDVETTQAWLVLAENRATARQVVIDFLQRIYTRKTSTRDKTLPYLLLGAQIHFID